MMMIHALGVMVMIHHPDRFIKDEDFDNEFDDVLLSQIAELTSALAWRAPV